MSIYFPRRTRRRRNPLAYLSPSGEHFTANQIENVLFSLYSTCDIDDEKEFAEAVYFGKLNDQLGELLHAEIMEVCKHNPKLIAEVLTTMFHDY